MPFTNMLRRTVGDGNDRTIHVLCVVSIIQDTYFFLLHILPSHPSQTQLIPPHQHPYNC